MRNSMFLKMVSIIVAVSFLWTNCVWANGELSAIRSTLNANKLAAQPQAADIGRALAEHPAGARLLAGEAVLERLGVGSLGDIVENMQVLTEAGAKCFVSTDADGNTAKYIIEDGALLRKTPADKKVNDKFYRALQLLGIEGRSETMDGEFREYIYVTEKNERFINSILALLSNNNPEWVVKAVSFSTSSKSTIGAPVGQLPKDVVIASASEAISSDSVSSTTDQQTGKQANRPTGKPFGQIGFFISEPLIAAMILSVIGVLVYTFREGILAWILERTVGEYIIGGLIGAGFLVALYFIIWRYVFPVSWYLWRLKSEDSEVRKNSAEALGILGDKGAVESLLKLLGDSDSGVRKAVHEALDKLGATKDQLVIALNSSNYGVRMGAAEVLGKLGDIRAVEPLMERLGKGDLFVRNALDKLGTTKEQLLTGYITALKSRHSYEAAEVLGKLGDTRAVKPLLKLLGDSDSGVRKVVREALDKLGATKEQLVYGYITALKSGHSNVRKAVAEALGNLGDARAIEPLLKLLGDDYVDVRREAVSALGKLGDARAVEPLLKLLGDSDSDVRRAVAGALGKLGATKEQLVDGYIQALQSSDWRARKESAEALGNLGDARAVEPLLKLLGDSDSDVRRVVREALDKLGAIKEHLVDGYIQAIQSNDSDARRESAEALGEMGSIISIESLLDLFASRKDELLRLKVELANTPETIEQELYDFHTHTWSETVSNPEYEQLRAQITNIKSEITAIEEALRKLGVDQPTSQTISEPTDGVPSQLTTVVEGPEQLIARIGLNHQGVVGQLATEPATGEQDNRQTGLTKLAGILGVSATQVPEVVQAKLQCVLDSVKKAYPGILGAAREIVLVDNLGGIDSDVPGRNGALAVFQNGVIAIDIDAFRNDKVLYDVVLHELWHSVLELVEGNRGVEEAAAVYQSLLYFAEMTSPEQTELITFLRQKDNGLDSEGYAVLLQMVQEKGLKGEALISVAISYVLSEARYAGIREGLTEGMDGEVKKAVQKLKLATEIYQEIMQAIDRVPAVGKVKNAVEKSKILMKVKMIASRWSIDTGFIDKLRAQGKYVQLDVNELEKKSYMIDWLKRLTAEQQGAFIFKSGEQASAADFMKKHGLQGVDANEIDNKGIARSNIITLLELGALDTSQDMPENSGLYLPYIYSVTGIYLAAQIILAEGKFEDIEDNLAKTTLMATLGLSDPNDLNALFRGKWPKLFKVSEIINELREAIRQTEIAA